METKMLDNYVLNSKIKSKNVTNKEKWLGYLIGPIGALLLKPAFARIKKRMDASEVGGGILLGVSAPVIKAHGSSDSIALMNAIRQARETVSKDVVAKISQALKAE